MRGYELEALCGELEALVKIRARAKDERISVDERLGPFSVLLHFASDLVSASFEHKFVINFV